MLSNASMQQKKQNTTRLGSALTGSPSEPRSHRSITSDWQSIEVSDSTVFEREALHPQPISCQEIDFNRLCRVDFAVAYRLFNCGGHGSRFRCGATAALRCI